MRIKMIEMLKDIAELERIMWRSRRELRVWRSKLKAQRQVPAWDGNVQLKNENTISRNIQRLETQTYRIIALKYRILKKISKKEKDASKSTGAKNA